MDTILATAVAARFAKEDFSPDDYQQIKGTEMPGMGPGLGLGSLTDAPMVDSSGVPVRMKQRPSVWGNTTSNLMGLLIGSFAAYLSWQCNTAMGYPLYLKAFLGFFAFTFGGLYLMYYALFRYDVCRAARK